MKNLEICHYKKTIGGIIKENDIKEDYIENHGKKKWARARGLKFTATVLTIITKLSQYLQVLGKKRVQNTETCHSVRKDVEEVLDQATPPDSMVIEFTEDIKSGDEADKAKGSSQEPPSE